jgi:N-acetylmuramic acid 6-phosphate etherase
VFGGVTEDVIHHDPLTAFDVALADWLHARATPAGTAIAEAITLLGSPVTMSVVGVTASGTTPYVLAALKYARGRGATTVAITSNRKMPAARLAKIVIAAEVGPEVLTGSTRMKAGTAQKMVLNMLSTATMARLGHVYENLMIDVVQTNEKVTRRALRILAEASGRSVSAAEHALRAAGHNMRVALVMLKRTVDAQKARELLAATRGDLRQALEE